VTQLVLRGAFLAAVYLLVLTSLKPADIAIAAVLGVGTAYVLRPRKGAEGRAAAAPDPVAALRVLGRTAAEMVRGSWRSVRFCLGPDDGRAGFVEIPREGRSRHNVAFWALLTGESPDEVPVDVDEERDVLIVHLVDASDPEAVRARHRADAELQRKVVP
jgi:multisubunit Na+/H+ antiporter MnhE subunit